MTMNPGKLAMLRARQAGFTIVEVMIAMLIGLIGIVVIMQVFAVSEGFKRTATSGTDATVNGGIALYMLERELRNAGFGLNNPIAAGCMTTRVWNSTANAGRDVPLHPVAILDPVATGIPAPDLNTDMLMISFGSSDSFVEGVQVDQASTTANFRLWGNRQAFRSGDLVVGVEPGAGAGGGPQCTLHELTRVPQPANNCNQGTPGGGAEYAEHNVTSYLSSYRSCAATPTTRNKAGGITDAGGTPVAALKFTDGARVYNLGGAPAARIYAIRGGNLTMCEWLSTDCTQAANFQVVADNIVSMRAVYGQDFDGSAAPGTPAGDGQVDRWTRAVRADTNQVARTLAIGLQITARSALREKPNTGPACDATTDAARPDKGQALAWYAQYTPVSGSLTGADINLTNVTDWQCYRYKLFQTTVPIRNMIWRP